MRAIPPRNAKRDGLRSTRQNGEAIRTRSAGKRRSLVVKKRAASSSILLSSRNYVRLDAPVADVLMMIGEESIRNRTDTLSSRQIDRVIKATRTKKSKR
jgi:hypothetical protein